MKPRILAVGMLVGVVGLASGAWPAAPAPATKTNHRLELHFATGVQSVRDDVLVPIAFSGPAAALGVGYGVSVGRNRAGVDARLGLGLLFDRYDSLSALLHHELALRYQRDRLDQDRDGLAWGAVLRSLSEGAFLASWDDAHLYWLAGLTLGPQAAYHRRVGDRWAIDVSGDLALVALMSRPPARRLNKQEGLTHPSFYLSRLAADPQWTTVLESQWLRLAVVALRRARGAGDEPRWGLGCELRVSHARDPAPFAALYTGLTVRRGWTW